MKYNEKKSGDCLKKPKNGWISGMKMYGPSINSFILKKKNSHAPENDSEKGVIREQLTLFLSLSLFLIK